MTEYTITRDDAAQDELALRKAIAQYQGDPRGLDRLRALADSIEEQVKPAIEEPIEFGSLVRAWSPTDPEGVAADTWQMSPAHGKHYWQSQAGKVEVWAELTLSGVEVLRVGVGETPGDAWSRGYEEGVDSNRPSPLDRSAIHSALVEAADDATTAVMQALS